MSKSDFMASAEWMKDNLGPSLCLAKWKQVSLHLPTGLNNSCYHPPLHSIDADVLKDNPGALHNTAYKKQQRVIMLKDEKPSECSYCWNIEAHGQLSDRHYRSGEPWAASDYDSIKNSTGEEDVVPSYVEVNFNHACNLKCSYCSPQFSSSWQQEVDRWGGYPTSTIHNDPGHFTGRNRPIPTREDNPYVDAFWEWWPTLYPHLKHFRMTGGEPLMDRNTYKVFDYVLALPNPELHLNVTSNFSVEEALFEKYLGYVKRLCNTQIEHFMQYVSLDSGNIKHAEYIRHGLNMNRLHEYVNRFLTEIPYRNSLTFIITMNNLSVLGIQQQLDWILSLRKKYSSTYQRVWFDTPLLRQPAWQSLQILPDVYVGVLERVADWMELHLETAEDPFHGFKDYEVQRMRRDIDWMKEGRNLDPAYVKLQRADFHRFFREHDQRRNTDFLKTFPEMREFWKECEYYAKN
ncbi:Radical_SAM domain containing protein [uncultured Caudovirales phage]|jgi:organic radical activating enzyme|uniref:Radical_SAM domain containing protein n=1 Tax=uncultured Caudovirales phage TaxID=2100421 RepID=A0A6J7WLM4_9CAUD|nr:Radical_SAM domain containing protein [uncultured Caudovirales phage]